MRVNLEHPEGTIRNKITIELSDNDLDHIRHMAEGESLTYTIGYAAMIVLKKEKKEEDDGEGL